MTTPLGSVRYQYDASGLRVGKITNLGTDLIKTRYTYSGGKLAHMTYSSDSNMSLPGGIGIPELGQIPRG